MVLGYRKNDMCCNMTMIYDKHLRHCSYVIEIPIRVRVSKLNSTVEQYLIRVESSSDYLFHRWISLTKPIHGVELCSKDYTLTSMNRP